MRDLKLSAKLSLLIIAVVVIFSLATSSMMILIIRSSIRDVQLRSLADSVNAYANAASFYLEGAVSALQNEKRLPQLTDFSSVKYIDPDLHGLPAQIDEDKRNVALSVLNNSQTFEYIILLKADGTPYLIEPYNLQIQLQNDSFAFTSWYQELVSGAEYVISDLNISPVTQRPTVVIAIPLKDAGGNILGIWAGGIKLEVLSTLGFSSGGTNSGRLGFITDKRGLIIAHQARPQFVVEQTDFSAVPPVQAALAGSQCTIQFVSPIDGLEKLGAYTTIKNTDWAVVYEVPISVAFAPVGVLVLTNVILSVLRILLIVTGVLYIVRRVIKPLNQLQKAAAAVGTGDLSQRIEVKSRDEIGLLGLEFNRMAESLETQVQERQDAEKAQIKAEKEATAAKISKDILDYILDPVLLLDLEGKITQFNRAFTRRFGYGDEVIGRTSAVLVIESEIPEVAEVIREVKEKGFATNIDYTCITKYNKQFPIILNASLTRDLEEKPSGIVAVFRDITLRKKAEEQLLKAEERYHSTLNNMMEGCQIIGFDWHYLYINDMAVKHGRLTKAEYIGHTMMELFPGIEYTEMFARLCKSMQDRTSARMENKFIYQDGEPAWFELNIQPVPEGLFILSLDITQRKQSEEILARKSEELARSNTELQHFAYVASHDLQEPLRMITSYVQLLQRRYTGKLDQAADDFINYAVDGATRMGVMINDLLQLSRVESQGKPFQLTDCEKVLERALQNLQISISESGAIVKLDPLPKVSGDEVQLTQLFQNLIANAIKFRGEKSPEIHISAKRNENDWIFSVKDNGIGIEPQYFERIFIIFKRLHNKQEYPGSGIGLALCKKIVERHGGKIWVESTLGKGSTFYFSIPVKGEKSYETDNKSKTG
jgi:PAS domain S-box-containing protein